MVSSNRFIGIMKSYHVRLIIITNIVYYILKGVRVS
jgi:hypothetical protein